jgi:hypothetical protein
MIRKILFLSSVSLLLAACNSKEKMASTRPVNIPEGKVEGMVSHKYNNCGAVVVLKSKEGETVLIPFPELDKQYDSDGLVIQFNYRKLRMAHPGVCTTGVMAELSNIVKSN